MGESEVLFSAVDMWFDQIRPYGQKWDFYVEKPLIYFEWALIREIFFVSDDGKPDWKRILESIGR